MITRQLETWLTTVASYPHVVHILGLRQTGKTTLMEKFRQRYPKSLYYPLYDLVTLRRYESHPEMWVLELEAYLQKTPEREILNVFVDEIQKIPAFFQAIQGLYQKYKGKIKFWIWGSSARPLKRQRAETLAGRSVSKILWPFSQTELLGRDSCVPLLFNPQSLEKSIQVDAPRGYTQKLLSWAERTFLPEPNLEDDMTLTHSILQSYQATYLENEIRRENLVQDIGLFERFLALAASEDAEITNDASKAKVLGISPHTIKAYYGILEDTFVCKKLYPYSKSLRIQMSKSPKVYFTDSALARFICGERGLPIEDGRQFGRWVEGFVINEVLKQIEYHELPWTISYFRTKSGLEVDLIITNGQIKIAVEIKATCNVDRHDFNPIVRLMELDPDIQYGIVFSRQGAPFQLAKKIYNVPIWNL